MTGATSPAEGPAAASPWRLPLPPDHDEEGRRERAQVGDNIHPEVPLGEEGADCDQQDRIGGKDKPALPADRETPPGEVPPQRKPPGALEEVVVAGWFHRLALRTKTSRLGLARRPRRIRRLVWLLDIRIQADPEHGRKQVLRDRHRRILIIGAADPKVVAAVAVPAVLVQLG